MYVNDGILCYEIAVDMASACRNSFNSGRSIFENPYDRNFEKTKLISKNYFV